MKTDDAVSWIAEVFEEPAGRITIGTLRKEIPGWDSLGTYAHGTERPGLVRLDLSAAMEPQLVALPEVRCVIFAASFGKNFGARSIRSTAHRSAAGFVMTAKRACWSQDLLVNRCAE